MKLRSLTTTTGCILILMAMACLSPAPAMAASGETLDEAEIAQLKETSVDASTLNKLQFEAAAKALNRKNAFNVTCALYEIKELGSEKRSRRLGGASEIRVYDSTKRLVLSATKSLDKMCAS